MSKIVAISANIGVGKTTLLGLLEARGIVTERELVEDWKYLGDFYRDQHTAVLLQLEILLSRHGQFERASRSRSGISVIERSTLDSLHVFAYNALKHGNMRLVDYELLRKYTAKFGVFPDHTIYLRCAPEVAYERANSRSRDTEKGLDLDYIRQIHECYEEFASKYIRSGITIIDVTELTPEQVCDSVVKVLGELDRPEPPYHVYGGC